MKKLCVLIAVLGMVATASGAVTSSTAHGPDSTSLNGMIQAGDLLSGKIGVEEPGDLGWHPANTKAEDRLPAFTDDLGILSSGVTGLMNDFPTPGNSVKSVRFDFGGPTDIGSIGILTGNNGKDGRVFSTTVIEYSSDGGANYNLLGYFQSDLSSTQNSGTIGSTYVTITDDASNTLLAGATNLRFNLYAVDNTGGQMRDPFDGVNPYTGADDGLSAAFVSPLVLELDASTPVPEPATLGLLVLGGILLRRRRA